MATYFVSQGGAWVWVHNGPCPVERVSPRPYTASPDGVRLYDEAKAYRGLLEGDLTYRNIATADVLVDGEARTVRFLNEIGGLHSEERLIQWKQLLTDQGRKVQVLRVFTERPPCTWSANCSAKLAHEFGSDLEVYFSQLSGPTH